MQLNLDKNLNLIQKGILNKMLLHSVRLTQRNNELNFNELFL